MAGVQPFTYWLSHYLFDVVISLWLTGIVSVTFILDTHRTFWSLETIVTLAIFLGIFLCWSSPPWIYYLTTMVSTKLGDIGYINILHMVLGKLATWID